jgi:hypothetical protein
LTFFALENDSRVLCYANANLRRIDQPGELLRFVEFWQSLTGSNPQWLYFDSKLVPYTELARLQARGIWFITIRRRGGSLLRRLRLLPASAWQGAVIDTPKRCHQHIRYVDEMVRLRDYGGWVRQLAVDGLGREAPTLFLSNNVAETARNLIIRYAGRNRIEDGLGTAVNFFHLDCLASDWLGRQLRGFEKAAPKQLYRRFVATAGTVIMEADRIVVQFDRRCHNPILREAALDGDPIPIPWWHGRSVTFSYL